MLSAGLIEDDRHDHPYVQQAHGKGGNGVEKALAERPDLADEMTLLVDVGTNAEIVLGNRHRLVACSSPTGPAFEGALWSEETTPPS